MAQLGNELRKINSGRLSMLSDLAIITTNHLHMNISYNPITHEGSEVCQKQEVNIIIAVIL